MGFKLQVPGELAEQIVAKHGNPVYLVSGKDWEKVRRAVKKNKKVNDALVAADVRLYEIDITPIIIRNRNGSMVKRISSQKGIRK